MTVASKSATRGRLLDLVPRNLSGLISELTGTTTARTCPSPTATSSLITGASVIRHGSARESPTRREHSFLQVGDAERNCRAASVARAHTSPVEPESHPEKPRNK